MKAVLALFVSLTLLVASVEAEAARVLPSGLLMGPVRSASYPFITLEKPKRGLVEKVLRFGRTPVVTYRLTVGVRIRTEEGRFIVTGMLPTLAGKVVAMRGAGDGDIDEIWVLTREEAEQYAGREGTRFPR
jgi:hypothetical protein